MEKLEKLPRAAKLAIVAALSIALGFAAAYVAFVLNGPFTNGDWFNRFWFVFFSTCFFVAGCFWALRDLIGDEPEWLYLVICLAVGLMFSYTNGVWEMGFDDSYHFRYSILWTDLDGSTEINAADDYMLNRMMLKEDVILTEDNGIINLKKTDDIEADIFYEDMYRYEWQYDASPKNAVKFVYIFLYTAGALLVNALELPFLWQFLIPRMMGTVFYAVVTFLGMRKIREGKALYALACLIPTSIFIAANYSYTYWLSALTLYGCACMAGMFQGSTEASVPNVLKMVAALVLATLPRPVYFLLLFVALLIPEERYASKRACWVMRGVIVVGALVAASAYFVPLLQRGSFGGGDSRGGDNVNPDEQVRWILSHPGEYASILWNFFFGPFMMEGGGADVGDIYLVGGFLTPKAMPGLLINYDRFPRAHEAFGYVYTLLLLFCALTDRDGETHHGPLPEVAVILMSAIICILFTTLLYIDFTNVGLEYVRGVQRRYFLPLVYPLLAFVGPARFGLTGGKVNKGVYNGIIIAAATVILVLSWWTAYVTYLR